MLTFYEIQSIEQLIEVNRLTIKKLEAKKYQMNLEIQKLKKENENLSLKLQPQLFKNG